jgi:PIN domain nuclease of toxin-antitoxin system
MRYFIDTNIFLFLCGETHEVDKKIKALLEDYANTVVMSSESLREIASLIRENRIHIKGMRSYDDVKARVDALDMEIRYVTEAHMKTFFKLLPVHNHSDPVDLMIIAQAITEKIPLISSDKKFPFYTRQGLEFIPNRRKGR